MVQYINANDVNNRGYMNKLTRNIKDKGYSLPEFCKAIGFSLRWYREHEKQDNKQNKLIVDKINELENKQ